MATPANVAQRLVTATQEGRVEWTKLDDGTYQTTVDHAGRVFIIRANEQGALLREASNPDTLGTLNPGATLNALLEAIAAKDNSQFLIDTLFDGLG